MTNRAISVSMERLQWRYLEGCVSNDSFGAGALVSIAWEGSATPAGAQALYCLSYTHHVQYIAYEMKPDHQLLLASVGAAVRRLREERSLTRRELAQRSGVSERFLAE